MKEKLLFVSLFLVAMLIMAGLMTCGLGKAHAYDLGDKGISYLNYSAYCASQVEGECEWVLRHGSDEDWENTGLAYSVGHYNLMILWNSDGDGHWVAREIISTRYFSADTGFFPVDMELIDFPDDMKLFYMYKVPGENRAVKVQLYKDSSLGFIEGLIWDMSWNDYYEGQKGQ